MESAAVAIYGHMPREIDMVTRYEKLLVAITEATQQNKAVNESLLSVAREMSAMTAQNSAALSKNTADIQSIRDMLLKYLKWAIILLIMVVGGISIREAITTAVR